MDGHSKGNENYDEDLPADAGHCHKLLIHPERQWKKMFDIWILLLVAYSCISNILFIAYSVDDSGTTLVIIYWFVESFFYLDFCLAWFSGFRNEEDQKTIMEFKLIAKNYVRTWFIIDFVSIFPFQLVTPGSQSKATKLFRMPRLLKIQKLLDV